MMFAASIHACLSVAYMSPRYQDIVYGQVFDYDDDHRCDDYHVDDMMMMMMVMVMMVMVRMMIHM